MPIDTLLPVKGSGFVTNNRGNDQFQFGQKSSIDAAVAVAAAWHELHADRPMSIGQISKNGGGNFFPPHRSHKLGVDIDVRPIRKDGANAPVTISESQYDRALTAELIDLWWTKAPVQSLFFNDPTVIAAGLSQFVNNHHHHFHVRLRTKDATIKMGDRGSDVAEVQQILGLLEPDGRFGPATLQAVEQFQEENGLEPDGVVGPKTWAKLRNTA